MFINQYSRYVHVFGIKEKWKAADVFENYTSLDHVIKYFRNGVEILHTDGDGDCKCEEESTYQDHAW